jgi:hypothetical protein
LPCRKLENEYWPEGSRPGRNRVEDSKEKEVQV